jgi:hypothetical protein
MCRYIVAEANKAKEALEAAEKKTKKGWGAK